MIVRLWFYILSLLSLSLVIALYFVWPPILYVLILLLPLIVIGCYDIFQRHSNVLRNYPIWGHWRYILLSIRPQIQQYFIATEQSGRPFNKEMRDLVYARANQTLDTLPFGTLKDVYNDGYEWLSHSLMPVSPTMETAGRILIGNAQCAQPYCSSRLNISAMSFGALSQNAVRALNRGACIGGFAHNTGEGGLSQYHLMEGGDLIWQIGTGYFGCRNENGGFDPQMFKDKANHPQVKMIEIKLSQGAKPAHGGMLPGIKVTAEIAKARHIPKGKDCMSPHAHSTFDSPIGLLEFVQQLRELSGGKPVGFKLCLGIRADFMSICKAMLKTKIYPDFITVDGAEGGTGAAPVEFTDSLGAPLNDGLIFVHNCLVGMGLRQHITLIASGKIISGFDMAAKIAIGADVCHCARGMLFALGCIQSRRCHNNTCPTGITTQDPRRMYALNVQSKAPKVANYHRETVASFLEVLGACGLHYPEQLTPGHVHRRLSGSESRAYDQLYTFVNEKAFLDGDLPDSYRSFWQSCEAESFCRPDNVFGHYWREKKGFYVRSNPAQQ